MNIGEVVDRLTISQETVQNFYNEGYADSQFKVKDTSVFTEDVVKYFNPSAAKEKKCINTYPTSKYKTLSDF